ncbi:MAG: hypothetical protein A2822_03250 [Candidatus Staskawiczbacteria bacterium RIFCSPHIGHO2_01_FULL_41_41]|uniref:Uncharacterized protein n=1 Tax=Candidatus Staskawiczbacteria bacterium RIFCSPHIGHO2_01_FULL_41_41 TaxID=1802203 RepID=A0A1G2HVY0_9BACT|nr:MAG: hypothetical protein A2822_03250 [Candidatus Staskawiczbacteria bacterium RIFCSPHIGHO2_01_FULL_41_41]HLD79563.1 hypothetical protein [Candidatus Nanoarchaeia archaeon]
MFEIPTVKIELYHQDRARFAQQLGQALEHVGVAQVNRVRQDLVDQLYKKAEEVFDECAPFRAGLGDPGYYAENTSMKNIGYITREVLAIKFLRDFPKFRQEAEQFQRGLQVIAQRVLNALSMYLETEVFTVIDDPNLVFFRYPVLSAETKERIQKQDHFEYGKPLLLNPHEDDENIILFPTATQPGLEGLIGEEWVPLNPEPGHCLIIPGKGLYQQIRRIKPLKHQVSIPPNSVLPRLAMGLGF